MDGDYQCGSQRFGFLVEGKVNGELFERVYMYGWDWKLWFLKF